jgi:hypothetical protein
MSEAVSNSCLFIYIWFMQRFLGLLLFIFLVKFSSLAQNLASNDLKKQVGFAFGMSRLDFFSGFYYSKELRYIQPFASAEFGVNRSVFQKRFFPRLSVGANCFVISTKKFHFGPYISHSYSFLKVNANSNHFHHWNELYIGTRTEVGNKLRFTNSIATGWMNERFYSQTTNRVTGVNSLGFFANIGLSYVW